MNDEKKHRPNFPSKPADGGNKSSNDISKGENSADINESVDWSRIEKSREGFTNNLPDYDAPPPPKGDSKEE
jgi:hypothetical protein